MIHRLRRARVFLKAHGPKSTVHKIVRDTLHYAANTPQRLRYRAFQRRLKDRDARDVFVEIYERNMWESTESRSGIGSEAVATESIRAHLPLIFEKFHVKSMLDAPCGDFNWMRLVSLPPDMSYLGWDIVPQVIRGNSEKYANHQRRFGVADMFVDSYPRVDLMMCRDCLFHFSHRDICRTLENFVASGTPYLLTTTHTQRDASTNTHIETGFFRRIDLFAEPFGFPRNALYRFDDHAPNHLAREMCLWDRSQVEQGLANLRGFLARMDSRVPT
jgi:hypothetical protein